MTAPVMLCGAANCGKQSRQLPRCVAAACKHARASERLLRARVWLAGMSEASTRSRAQAKRPCATRHSSVRGETRRGYTAGQQGSAAARKRLGEWRAPAARATQRRALKARLRPSQTARQQAAKSFVQAAVHRADGAAAAPCAVLARPSHAPAVYKATLHAHQAAAPLVLRGTAPPARRADEGPAARRARARSAAPHRKHAPAAAACRAAPKARRSAESATPRRDTPEAPRRAATRLMRRAAQRRTSRRRT